MTSRFLFSVMFGVVAAGALAAPALAQGGGMPPGIVMPTDPIEKAAFDMLDKHCSRCHQDGKLGEKLKPAGRFGNILDLKQIAATPHYVVPGNPDNSRLFAEIAELRMPYDVFMDKKDPTPDEPTPQEIEALRTWIAELGKRSTSDCSTRKFVKNTDVVARIAADLQSQRDFRVKGMRYLTFAHHWNGCATEANMEGFRHAAVKLLNSLSNKTDVVRLEPIDPERTIIRFNIDDLGWSESDWNTILASYPYGTKPEGNLFTFLTSATGSALPYVRADWFTFAAAQPPLYDKLLRLPDTAQGLEKSLNLDTLANIDKMQVKRAGFQVSGVSSNNRMIERHTIASGYFWTSYDFAGNKDKQSLFKHPLGPKGDNAFHHDGGESFWSLPNGFQAYYLSTADGKQLRQGPTAIVRDPSRRDFAVTNGVSCMGCHATGIIPKVDNIRKTVLSDRSFSRADRDSVEAMYVVQEEMDAIMKADTQRFQDAMRRAGIDSALKVNGEEMINGYSKFYEDQLSLRQTAAEFGLTEEQFVDAAANAGVRALNLMKRVRQNLVPRDTFELEFPEIVEALNDETSLKGKLGAAVAVAVPKPEAGSTGQVSAFGLVLTTDKTTYKQGEAAVVTFTTKKTCNLTLINVDGAGSGTIIFPNRFQQDNRVEAGRTYTFGDTSAFKFRLADKGTETIIAECNADKTAAKGFEADYKAGGFTDLGDYSKRVTRQIATEGKARVAQTRKIVVEAGKKDAQAEAAVKPATGIPGAVSSTQPTEPDTAARTAIKFAVN